MEVCYGDRCGTVCFDGWDDNYASLMCEQLGFGPSGEAADFGPGTGVLLMEILMCSLNDTFPSSCSHYGLGVTIGCDRSKDIGVKCREGSTTTSEQGTTSNMLSLRMHIRI